MVMSSTDNARPMGADSDTSRPRMVPARSNATSPHTNHRTITPDRGNVRRPTSAGRSFNGMREPSPSHDECRRSPLRQSNFPSPNFAYSKSSKGACRRTSTTQFAYPGHSTGLTDCVSEQFRDLSFEDFGARSYTRSMDLGGMFAKVKESPRGGGGERHSNGSFLMRTMPEDMERMHSAEVQENLAPQPRKTSAMLDPHWHRHQEEKNTTEFSPTNRVSGPTPVERNSPNVFRSSLYSGDLQGEARRETQASPSPEAQGKGGAMRPSWQEREGPPRSEMASNMHSPRPEHGGGRERSEEEEYITCNRETLRRMREKMVPAGMEDIEASVAGLMKRCQFLEAENEFLREKEIDLRGDLCRSRAENAAISSELKRTHDLYREALGARRNAREALSEMAQQNARLVSAYVEKKQEFRSIQDSFEEDRRRWQAQIEHLEHELNAARQVQAMESPLFSDSDTLTTGVSGTNSSDEEESFSMSFAKLSPSKQENGTRNGVSGSPEGTSGREIHSRAFQEIQLENLRLQEENKKLKQHCADADKEKKQADLALKEQQVEDMKQRGNEAFREKKWEQAIKLYTQAILMGTENKKMNAVLYCNRACCLMKMERLLEAVSDSHMAISLDSDYYKAYMRRSEALSSLGDHAGALQDLRAVVAAKCSESSEAHEKMKVAQVRLRSGHPLEAYKVLSVPEDASPAEIRVAYKRLALKYHPDKAECKETSAIIFKMIAEANTILSDIDKKREHDLTRAVLKSRRSQKRG
ncbi:hypothetical protein BSKO_08641 [Bryopsis sp. KO-2023]|nr:hypothetical protein BSKO_08641 [Bryopsis sp. KO-2023]